jgi:anti-sigma regulatory factor (Ser/Thr protein kinase)
VAVSELDAQKFPLPDQSGRWIQLALPSRLEMLGVLDGLVQGITNQMEFSEDAAIEVATSVIEAGTNAIQHGHGSDAQISVLFRFFLGEDALEVWVRDSGPGFDVNSILDLDPTRPEDLLKARGRGIFIMRAMMDRVEFDVQPGQGTLVHLIKSLRRGNGSAAATA